MGTLTAPLFNVEGRVRGVKPHGICGMVEKHVVALCRELLPCWPCYQLCSSQTTAWWEVMGM